MLLSLELRPKWLASCFHMRVELVAEPFCLRPQLLVSAHEADIRVVNALVPPLRRHAHRAATALRSRVASKVLVVGHVHLHLVQCPVVGFPLLLRKNFGLDVLQFDQYFLVLLVDLVGLSGPDLAIEGALPVLWKTQGTTIGVETLLTRSLSGEDLVDLLKQVLVPFINRLRPLLFLQLALHP